MTKVLLPIFLFLSLFACAQDAKTQTTPAVEPSKGLVGGKLVRRVSPIYPKEALDKRRGGTVVLKATISKEGKLADIAVVSGDPILVPAALEAVKQWEYEPYKLGGQPVEIETSLKINFVLPTPALYQRSDSAPEPEEYKGIPLRVRVSQGVTEALLMKKVTPHYPLEARQDRIQGAVVFAVLLDYDGKVKTLKLVSGHPALVLSALEAVKQWEYKPYYLNGKPVQVESQITVTYTLSAH